MSSADLEAFDADAAFEDAAFEAEAFAPLAEDPGPDPWADVPDMLNASTDAPADVPADVLEVEALALEPHEYADMGNFLLEPSDVVPIDVARRDAASVDSTRAANSNAVATEPFDEPFAGDEPFADEPFPAPGEAASESLPCEVSGSYAELAADAPVVQPAPLRVPLWSSLNTLGYAFVRGLRGMGQSPLVQLLAVGTMAVCMLLLGTATLIAQNARSVAQTLGVDVPVTVYMEHDVAPESTVELAALLRALPEVERADRITPEQALGRLESGLGQGLPETQSIGNVDRGSLLAGIDASTLPDSIEITLAPGVESEFADALAARVQGMEGVEEVTVLGPWVQQAERMMTTLRWLAIGVGALVSLACLAIVWSTIRLGVFARRAELSILRLVGGTARFVRAPFVVEGVVQGVLGTALALIGLWLAFDLLAPLLERGLALVFAAGSIQFFTSVEIALALAFGGVIGLIGSRAAVARYAEA